MRRLFHHPEARVVAFVLAVLAVGEAGMRLCEHKLSMDVEHLQSLSLLSEELAPCEGEHCLRVLFLGNSLTRYGVDADVFAATLSPERGQPVRGVKMNPDNTALADWYYAYRNFVSQPRRTPDLLVIGFEGDHLRDAPSIHTDRLGRYYCGWDDLDELFAADLPTWESRLQFAAGSSSAIMSNRDRIERRALDTLIPGYRDGIQDLNSRVRSAKDAALPSAEYSRLAKLLDLARADGVPVVFAAMPVRQRYDLDPLLLATVEQGGATIVDCRNVPGIGADTFIDDLHMNPDGAQLYSRFLAAQLETRWPHVARPVAHVAPRSRTGR